MKIAFIVTRFPSLSETFILNQITGLLDRGHEVDIFAARADSRVHGDVKKYRLLERTSYRRIPENKLVRLLDAAARLVRSSSRQRACLLKSLNIMKFGKKALTLSMFYAALPFLDRGQYDIVHCHFGDNGNLGVQLRDLGALAGKIIVTFHGHDVTSYPKQYGNGIYEDLFLKADLVTINSSFIRNKVRELGCAEEKIMKLPVGLRTAEFAFSRKAPASGGGIRLLTVGRLVEKKGMEYSIRAVAEVLKTDQRVSYSIVGDGPLRQRLEQLISQLGVGGRVRLLGWKDQDEVRQLYAESHIFILSSVTAENGDQEGQGLVLQEAQAMGLPVIATLHNGFPDSVQDGKSAFLVPERDVPALAERIRYLIDHPRLWEEMGKAGRRFVEEFFDSDTLNDRLVGMYQELLNGNERIPSEELLVSRSA